MRLKFLFLVLFHLCATFSYAQEYKNEFSLRTENDAYLFIKQDRYYTNGLFLNFRRATNQEKLGKRLEKLIYEVSVGQKMYNPYSGNAPNPERHDRPFAGYLYAGSSLNLLYKKERVIKLSAEFGTVGPNALGDKAQKLLHEIIGFYEIEGWDYQIKNELSANFSGQYTQLLHRAANSSVDFSADTYVNAGTTFVGAGMGILFRAGRLNQLFQSSSTNSVIGNGAKTQKLHKKESFFYAKPQFNFVGYDATIQGSMFKNNSPVTFDIKRFVFAQQVGYNYSTPRFTFDFSVIFKSKEVKSAALAHQYGLISLGYRIN